MSGGFAERSVQEFWGVRGTSRRSGQVKPIFQICKFPDISFKTEMQRGLWFVGGPIQIVFGERLNLQQDIPRLRILLFQDHQCQEGKLAYESFWMKSDAVFLY